MSNEEWLKTREAQDRATEKYTLGYWHQRVEELEIALSKRAQDHSVDLAAKNAAEARIKELDAELAALKRIVKEEAP